MMLFSERNESIHGCLCTKNNIYWYVKYINTTCVVLFSKIMAKSTHPSIVQHESVLLWVCPPKNREKYLASVILGHRRRAVRIPGLTTPWAPWWVLHRIITLSETAQSQLHVRDNTGTEIVVGGLPSLFLAGNISHRACLNCVVDREVQMN